MGHPQLIAMVDLPEDILEGKSPYLSAPTNIRDHLQMTD